jgi:ankyrin repeat protein
MNRKQTATFVLSCVVLIFGTMITHYTITPHLAVELNKNLEINARDIYTGITPLMQAAIDSDYEKAKLLIAQGADVNEVSASDDLDVPLNYALINGGKIGSLVVAKLLMDSGANVNAFNSRGVAPIHMLMLVTQADNRWDMLNELMAHGANINAQTIEDGSTMMHIAVTMNDLDWIDRVNKTYGQVINYGIKDHNGRTPLDLAIQLGHVSSIVGTQSVEDSLLRKPVYIGDNYDVSATDGQLRSGMQLAVIRSDAQYVKELLGRGADVNHQDQYGNTALHYAVYNSDLDMVQLLLNAKAAVNIINNKKQMALSGVFNNNSTRMRIKIAQLLIDAGAPVTYKDVRGLSFLDEAIKRNDKELISIIQKSTYKKK